MKFKATLSSDERLKSRKQINYLFDNGKQIFSHPLKGYYLIRDNQAKPGESLSLRFGVSVPKSLYKKAVVRNRIKRKIKESYRKTKADFLSNQTATDKSVDWFFIYIDRNQAEDKIESAVKRLFADLAKELA